MNALNETKILKIKKEKNLDRIVYFDYLRVFATLSVIMLHVSAQNWFSTDVNGFTWQIFNFFDSISRWGVPVFVMISGALFIPKEISIKKIYLKYVLKMLISFIVWSFIYMLFISGNFISKFTSIIEGHYHMWFIPMIIGLYICIPFIQLIVKNKKSKYFLILALIFAIIIPQFMMIIKDFGGEKINEISQAFKHFIDDMRMNVVIGYIGYFILGYTLNIVNFNKKQRIIIYLLGIIGAFMTIGLDLAVALKTQKSCSNYYGNFNINILFESVAVFTLFKYVNFKPSKIIKKMSKYTFGAYMVHALILEQLNYRIGLNTLSYNPILSVVFITSIVFIISFTISMILNYIPIIKKYVV